MKRLFIAEKPSLASAIAENLPGQAKKERTHITVGNDIVTWCVGHILEQAMPEDYEERYKRWAFDDLPIVPQQWKLLPKENCKAQLSAIKSLLQGCDVVVNAGDPDREGQLLVDEVLRFLGNRKPVKRILINDYNAEKVRQALANIQDNAEQQFKGWYESALTRSRFDWLFGLNLSRAYTLRAREIGYDGVLSVGRVQTPTLGLVVARDLAIENFKSVLFYTLTARLKHASGEFSANWRAQANQEGLDESGRLTAAAIAQALAAKIGGKLGKITKYEKTPKNEGAPLPFSLSTLQMAANDKYGYSAQAVLDACQALYEKHKLTSYPRTDCNYLSAEHHTDAPNVLAAIVANRADLAQFAAQADLKLKSAAFNDEKVTAHHAIIPTVGRANVSALSDTERNIYDMIVRAWLAQFFPPCQFLQTGIEVSIEGETFAANGKTPVSPGWREIYAPPAAAESEKDDDDVEDAKQTFPAMQQGDDAQCLKCDINNRKTSPPPRFTEKLLLAAMLDIHKYVTDPAAKKRLKEGQGIGTEATRAGIIEELKRRNFIEPKGKQIISTPAGRGLIAALPQHAKDPALTGICEQALDLVELGKLPGVDFINRNVALIERLVSDARTASLNVPVAQAVACPSCKTGRLRRLKGKNGFFWGCSNYKADLKCSASFHDARGKPNIART
jgi:DNA topoisomerase-3